jgi:hypothetical protein
MIAFFLIKRLVKTVRLIAVLALLAGGGLYAVHELKKDYVELPHTIARVVPTVPRAIRRARSTAAASGTGPASEVSPGVTSQHATVGRCGAIAVNDHASCGFAANVMRTYDAHPATTVIARSPVTHLTYRLACHQAGGRVSCVGGTDDNASIAFRS